MLEWGHLNSDGGMYEVVATTVKVLTYGFSLGCSSSQFLILWVSAAIAVTKAPETLTLQIQLRL